MKKRWEYKTLKEACIQLFAGGDVPTPYVSKIKTKEFSVPIYSNSVENEGLYGYTNSARVNEQAVTISARGTIGATFRRYEPFYPAIRLITAVPNKEILSIDYLFYALKILTIGNSGTSIPQLTIPNIKNISIPLPPLSEQKEIVEYLDSSFAKIDKLKENVAKNLEEAKALFQSALKDALEPKEGWEEKTLEHIATDIYRGSGIKRDQVTEEGISCVRYGEIYTTYNYYFDICKSHTNERIITSKKYFEYGDILFAITGESVEEIGKSIAYLGKEKCLAGGDIVVMKHNQIPKYLSYALSTPNAIKQKGYGKTKLKVVHTNIPSLKTIKIPIPSIQEQIEIAEFLDSLNEKVNALQQNYSRICNECDALKQAILRQVFE